ncbi:MAG: hypothetical protein ACM31C_09410 [Acidobacteriota bacterium]
MAAAAPARAQDRREVAVIALTDDPGAKQLSQAIYTALLGHWALQPTARRELDAALAGEFLDEDRELLREANQQRATAGDALAQFTYDQARDAAQRGLAALTGATPTRAAPLAADLAFVLGEALLDLHAVNDSYQMFRFVHALDPMRRVDPAAIDPDKLGAYDKAQTLRAAHYKLDVQGSGRVWIDGVDAGAAPGTFDVEAGYHLVQLVGPERVTAGKLVVVKHDDAVAIDDRPASEQLRLQRARLALHDAPAEAVSRAGPMKQLAQLLGVHDAVLIWKANDKLWVQTWRDREPGFSALREHGNESPGDVLAPLAPPKPPEPPHVVEAPRPLPPVTHVEDEPAWYRKRWVQASVAGGVIAAVVGAIVWSRHTTYISIMPGTSYVPQ